MRVSTSQQVNDIHFFGQAKALLKLQIVLLKVHSVIQSRKLLFFSFKCISVDNLLGVNTNLLQFAKQLSSGSVEHVSTHVF